MTINNVGNYLVNKVANTKIENVGNNMISCIVNMTINDVRNNLKGETTSDIQVQFAGDPAAKLNKIY